MKIPGFITVRTTSSRLPRKCFLPFGKMTVLEHIVLRTQKYGLVPVICTSTSKEDDEIEDLAHKYNVLFYRGSLNNKLLRWYECCRKYDFKEFHTVDADDPFFDGELMKKSFALLKDGYDVVCPTKESSEGSASVGYSLTLDIIEKALANTTESTDTEMMWYYLDKVPGLKKTILPSEGGSHQPLRLTLDYEEDYWLLKTVQRVLGNFASRNEVDELFMRNPDMYQINWFRNDEWANAQLAKKI